MPRKTYNSKEVAALINRSERTARRWMNKVTQREGKSWSINWSYVKIIKTLMK